MTSRITSIEDDGQRVFRFADPEAGLSGVVVVDSLTLGPATGGCRFWHYDDPAAMLSDARRLARGMSYKNAMAGLPLGGGKSVIRQPDGPFDRTALFQAFGRVLDEIGGDYLTAEDVGTTPGDMEVVRGETPFVFGLPTNGGRAGGDPSPWTALGVFLCIAHVCARRGLALSESRVAVQGLGHVGADLCRRLHAAGVKLVVSDVRADAVERIRADIPVDVMAPGEIHAADADIFAPCALGSVLNHATIPDMGARCVVGAANNQLATEQDAGRLHARGILYVPDFVANAGGIINVAAEYLGHGEDRVHAAVNRIPDRLAEVLDRAEAAACSPATIADTMARALIDQAARAMAGNEGKRPV